MDPYVDFIWRNPSGYDLNMIYCHLMVRQLKSDNHNRKFGRLVNVNLAIGASTDPSSKWAARAYKGLSWILRNSLSREHKVHRATKNKTRMCRTMVSTQPCQGRNAGSIPVTCSRHCGRVKRTPINHPRLIT